VQALKCLHRRNPGSEAQIGISGFSGSGQRPALPLPGGLQDFTAGNKKMKKKGKNNGKNETF